MRLVLTKNIQTQSESDLRESSLAQERVDYSEGIPPQIQVGERHLPGLTNMRPERRFKGKMILGDVILLQ
jgi:hypothetical protein